MTVIRHRCVVAAVAVGAAAVLGGVDGFAVLGVAVAGVPDDRVARVGEGCPGGAGGNCGGGGERRGQIFLPHDFHPHKIKLPAR